MKWNHKPNNKLNPRTRERQWRGAFDVTACVCLSRLEITPCVYYYAAYLLRISRRMPFSIPYRWISRINNDDCAQMSCITMHRNVHFSLSYIRRRCQEIWDNLVLGTSCSYSRIHFLSFNFWSWIWWTRRWKIAWVLCVTIQKGCTFPLVVKNFALKRALEYDLFAAKIYFCRASRESPSISKGGKRSFSLFWHLHHVCKVLTFSS